MRRANSETKPLPCIVGEGMIVLDVILDNGATVAIFKAGGTCGNVLAGLSFLGWKSIAISRAGTDLAGNIMVEELTENGVNTAYITREPNLATPRIVERLCSNGEYAKHVFLMRCPSCNTYLPRFRSPRMEFVDKVYKASGKPAVYFFDKVTPSSLKLARQYRESGSLVLYEPGSLRNMKEVEQGISVCHVLKYASDHTKAKTGTEVNKVIKKLADSYMIPLAIHTVGEQGLSYRMIDEKAWHSMKSFSPQELHDTCGAGDWATVGFLYQMQLEADNNRIGLVETVTTRSFVKRALKFAQSLSSFSCMFVGARGMSNSMDKNTIFQFVESRTEGRKGTQMLVSKDQVKKLKKTTQKEQIDKKACPICLMKT